MCPLFWKTLNLLDYIACCKSPKNQVDTMLEPDEVDDDYFTPAASASLANIFGRPATDERTENESLKYTAPKPQNSNQQFEDAKTTSCVFACALVGYEWLNNVYTQKGRLGFALVKIIKTGSHNIILYDSNKTTLSNASVTSKLKVTVKNSNYISYYDDQAKYWSLYGTENEIKKITDLLKTLDVTINTSIATDTNIPEPVKNREGMGLQEDGKNQAESDTDSSINKKTKASILNRMASMGQSVLPSNVISANKTSDSSDTNDTDHQIKAVRHKPAKGISKRNSTDKTDHLKRIETNTDVENPSVVYTKDMKNTSFFLCDQLVPLGNSAIVPSPSGNDTSSWITEQRICNSELRINMGRMSDKVDHLLSKVNNLEFKDQNEVNANINTEILQKLLREYENKIKVYEDLFKKMGNDLSTHSVMVQSHIELHRNIENDMSTHNVTGPANTEPQHNIETDMSNDSVTVPSSIEPHQNNEPGMSSNNVTEPSDIQRQYNNETDMSIHNVTEPSNVEPHHCYEETLQKKIEELQNIIKENDQQISSLQNDIEILRKAKNDQNCFLQKKISGLEGTIALNDFTTKDLLKTNERLRRCNNICEYERKMRSIMNETYQTIAANFENTKTYSGESIKRTAAVVIRKITLRILNDPD